MRYSRTRFMQAVDLLGEVLSASEPAERSVEKFFRRNKQMGSKDRRTTSEIVYMCVRRKLELETLVKLSGVSAPSDIEAIVSSGLLRYFGWLPAYFKDTNAAPYIASLSLYLSQLNDDVLALSEKLNLPNWLFHAMRSQFDEQALIDLGMALLQPAEVDIRANTLVNDQAQLLSALKKQGVEVEAARFAETGLRVAKRGPLQNSRSFRQGGFEFQDEGSQLVSWLAHPEPGQLVVDYCAGAGGKTLHLAELMRNKGRLIAADVHPNRLARLTPRLTRAKINIVETQVIDEKAGAASFDPNLIGKADCVLIDAPCSGVGTLRRNVGLKWTSQNLEALTALQSNILESAAQLVRPGGVLVYATCSFLHDENQCVVDLFLSKNKHFMRSQNWISSSDSGLARIRGVDASLAKQIQSRGELVLRPDLHDTDGFYAQRLERI